MCAFSLHCCANADSPVGVLSGVNTHSLQVFMSTPSTPSSTYAPVGAVFAYRKSCLLRLQRHLHELLLDQLPVLRQLGRVLDELSLGVNSAAAAAGNGGAGRLILEQVGTGLPFALGFVQ